MCLQSIFKSTIQEILYSSLPPVIIGNSRGLDQLGKVLGVIGLNMDI